VIVLLTSALFFALRLAKRKLSAAKQIS